MSSTLQRRALLALSLAAAAALTACGSSSVESALEPDRFLVVGDGFSDIGQGPNGTAPTVNDGSRLWTQELANYYNKTITSANAGGYSYAQAYARVSQADITGHNATSITDQVTKLLAESLRRHQGSISAEHGIGLVKKGYLESTRSADEIAVMRGIKRVLDPNGLMNPGKLFDA